MNDDDVTDTLYDKLEEHKNWRVSLDYFIYINGEKHNIDWVNSFHFYEWIRMALEFYDYGNSVDYFNDRGIEYFIEEIWMNDDKEIRRLYNGVPMFATETIENGVLGIVICEYINNYRLHTEIYSFDLCIN